MFQSNGNDNREHEFGGFQVTMYPRNTSYSEHKFNDFMFQANRNGKRKTYRKTTRDSKCREDDWIIRK